MNPLLVYCDGGYSKLDLQVTWTGGSFVSILLWGETASSICSFCFRVAADTIVQLCVLCCRC